MGQANLPALLGILFAAIIYPVSTSVDESSIDLAIRQANPPRMLQELSMQVSASHRLIKSEDSELM